MPLRVSGIIGSLLAFFVSGYTGVLLTFTNVPAWARDRYLLAPLFITSALNSAIAAVSLVLTVAHRGTGRTYGWLERLGDMVGLGEAALLAGILAALGRSARPLVGRSRGPLFWPGVVGLGTVVPVVLRKLERPHRTEATAMHVAAHLSVLMGGLMLRWVIVRAGQDSAEDPNAYFGFASGRR
jgi:formate-dependent nitrite reductase membrane component NrfD